MLVHPYPRETIEMLLLKPNCEHCDTNLAPDATDARICSYECTFCARCAAEILQHVCPNCTGPLLPRPPRPTTHLDAAPGSSERYFSPADLDAHPAKVAVRIEAAGDVLHLWEVVVDCADPAKLAGFYAALLGGEVVTRPSEWGTEWAYTTVPTRGPHLVAGPAPTFDGFRIAFQQVPEPKQSKVRLHLDIGTRDLDGATERAVALGATRLGDVASDATGSFVVLADPEGHEFCLVDA